MGDLRPRRPAACNSTPDGSQLYLNALEGAFGGDVDYAMLIKIYGIDPEADPLQPVQVHRRRGPTVGQDPCDGLASDHMWKTHHIVPLLEPNAR
jgi:hypothetical protein